MDQHATYYIPILQLAFFIHPVLVETKWFFTEMYDFWFQRQEGFWSFRLGITKLLLAAKWRESSRWYFQGPWLRRAWGDWFCNETRRRVVGNNGWAWQYLCSWVLVNVFFRQHRLEQSFFQGSFKALLCNNQALDPFQTKYN